MSDHDDYDDNLLLSPTAPRPSLARMAAATLHLWQGCRYQVLQTWDYTSDRLIIVGWYLWRVWTDGQARLAAALPPTAAVTPGTSPSMTGSNRSGGTVQIFFIGAQNAVSEPDSRDTPYRNRSNGGRRGRREPRP